MSSKQSTSKQDSRIAKKEVMVTRHKSAQMKRQLRVKDRSMKHVTDLLKSPTKETPSNQVPKNVQKPKTPPKLKQSLLKSVEKVQKLPEKVFKLSKVLRKKVALAEDVEFYPNKRKRTLDVKKVVLKPNHEMQMVASIVGSVKRKCGVPHKASSKVSRPKPPSPEPPVYSKLSMAEVISLMEDDLTDEDLMEILTCPSPVWWEDGPGEEYIEEAVCRRTPEPQPVAKKVAETAKKSAEMPEDFKIKDLNKKSERFLNKRSKLEGLLGNIKNKNLVVNKSVHNNPKENKVASSSNNIFNEDLVVLCSMYRKDKVDDSIGKDNTRARTKSDSDSDEVIFHDSSMNEDDLLRSLENTDIPIDNSKPDVIVIDDDDDDILEVTAVEIKKEQASKQRDDKDRERSRQSTDEKSKSVPKNLPVLHKCENVSPKSFDSSSSKSTPSQELDSISDTNIKFILDDEMDDERVSIKKENDSSVKQQFNETKNKDTSSVQEPSDAKSADAKTVDVKANQEDKTAKMNDYYKKCKKVYQKKERMDINKNDLEVNKEKEESDYNKTVFCASCLPKTRAVYDDKNVKYCLKCSGIFYTDNCLNCLKIPDSSKAPTCTACKTKFCCKSLLETHNKHTHSMVELNS